MRVGHVQPSRANYYDRNAGMVNQKYAALGVAPHGGTVRWTYTVPTGKKSYWQSGAARNNHNTVAAPVARFISTIQTNIAGGGTVADALLADSYLNTVGARTSEALSAIGLLSAGDQCFATTQDSSTGGTVDYDLSSSFVEFDA